MSRLSSLFAALWLLGHATGAGAGPPQAQGPAGGSASTTPDEWFEARIRPVLFEQCVRCHGAKKQSSGLRLDSREALLEGGENGPAIIPGVPDKSLIILAIRHAHEDIKMPPKGKLPDPAIEALSEWVRRGAPWPSGHPLPAAERDKAVETHWAFRPVRDVAPPPVEDRAWAGSAIDAFILAKLEAREIAPAPPADRRTLIRRATIDLTGLPPSAEEIEAFEADRSPEAFARVVDRLLASPRYGERWGRHWLDVARYADTKGYVFADERRYPYAYTYRDYVIRAFNADLPYDRFVVEQVAADRLPPGRDNGPLAALGFLTVGRRFLNDGNDIIDDRIDVVTRGLLGLTVACARCHDHKFDPIPTEDYYSLHGVFASSVEPAELPELPGGPAGDEVRDYEAKLRAIREKRGGPTDRGRRKEERAEIAALAASHPGAPPRAMLLNDRPQAVEPHVFVRGNPGRPGQAVPRRFLKVLSGPDRKPFGPGSGRLDLARAIASPSNPLTARVMVNRIWLHHFGVGLVSTPSDFGLRSDPPSHPELLDYLAGEFLRGGWSVKTLHRKIMLSSTYRQGGENQPAYVERDPENRLLWKFPRRRLDLESARDSLLAVSGELDTTIGGRPVPLFEGPFSARRTVYGMIDRQNLDGVYRAFDFPSPDATSPRRYVTTVPQQALFLMNSPFVIERARRLADGLATTSEPEARVRLLYRRVFGRAPGPLEVELGVRFVLERTERESAALPPAWRYGFGRFDESTRRVVRFEPFRHRSGVAWQFGPTLPDPTENYLHLGPSGGHVGRDADHAAIRRWTAPRDGPIAVVGELAHGSPQGDGVRGRIVSSRSGMLGEWVAHHTKVSTLVARLEVRAGETIDFVVDGRGNEGFDTFDWTATIRELGLPHDEWKAADGFARPAAPAPSPWEEYAQVLLLTNEFMFVD